MSLELSPQETAEVVSSLQRYFREELEQEIGEMRAKFLLEYFLKEIGPFAHNRGVKDAEERLRVALEDLPGVCFEPPLTFWQKKKKR